MFLGSQDGVRDAITVNAYVTMALLETQLDNTVQTVQRALDCVKAHMDGVTDTYTVALLAYTLTLAGETALRDNLMAELRKRAVREGNSPPPSTTTTTTHTSTARRWRSVTPVSPPPPTHRWTPRGSAVIITAMILPMMTLMMILAVHPSIAWSRL
eukprot:gi/632991011/ref/XP_007884432.1/ PREDICTED: alpha-1-inhibitor 3-like [Callorhinchus milii]